jgi:hypothetical protein
MTPEEKARGQIDAHFVASGWIVQAKDRINLPAKLLVQTKLKRGGFFLPATLMTP